MQLLLFALCVAITNAEYLFVHPRYVEAGKESSVCLTLKSMTPDSTGELIVQYARNDSTLKNFLLEKTYKFVIDQADVHVCNAITPPSEPGRYDVLVTVFVEHLLQKDMVMDEKAGEVNVQRADLITLIQTDKGIYKPGQTVKIRAITMNYDLMFQTDFDIITVESPNGLRMAQWKNMKAVNGLVSLEMPLSTDPVLGTWKVKAVTRGGQEVSETFKVDEYVLPKYEVTITPPKYLLTTSRTISGTVCAKYTYGKPVRGSLRLSVCYQNDWHQDERPCTVVLDQMDGCYEFFVDSKEIELGSTNYSTYGNLILEANVTEEETGVTLHGKSKGPSISHDVLTLTIEDDSNNFFKPGFPYRGRVIVKNPDGSPAPGEEIKVSANPWYYGPAKFSKTFLSDDNGIVHFVMPDMAQEHGSWHVKAEAVVYKTDWRYYYYSYWYVPSSPYASETIRKWTSPSNSYIYIPDVDTEADCDSEVVLDVYYTTPPGPTYTFTAILQAGSVIKSTNIFTETSSENIIDIISVDSSQVLDKATTPPPEPTPPLPTPGIEVYYEDIEALAEEEEIVPVRVEFRKKRGVNPTTDEPISEEEEPIPEEEAPAPEEPEVEKSRVISMFKLPIYVSQDMSPDVSVLLYYIRDDNEVVSTSINIKVKSCFRNKASMTFSDDTVKPGESVNLNLGAAPASTCFVGMVDKSVNLIGGYNQLTPAKVFENVRCVSRPSIWTYFYDEDIKYCMEKFRESESSDVYHYYYHRRYKPDGVDAVQPFRDMNMLVLTDATLQTRPCKWEEYRVMYYMSGAADGRPGPVALSGLAMPMQRKNDVAPNIPSPPTPKVRSLFPETWLWDMFQIGDDGQSSFELTVPDTITEWLGNTLCSHPEAGIGLTDLTKIVVFQPFFVSLNLPYSVIRGEKVPLTVTVFNYLENCLTMSVVLRETDGYENPSGVTEANICVCGGRSKSVKFYIIPTIIGEIDIEVVAYSIEDVGLCTNVILSTEGIGVSDGLQRQLLVEAEGVPQENAVSSYICLHEEGMTEIWQVDLTLPENLVPESERARVSVVGDVMGPTLSNLKNLLRMPYGCGEQNMASWAPNIYVLQYLTGTGQSTDKIEKEAKEYMAVGYQRQMKYRHSDFSYSAFGERSSYGSEIPSGSLWLTAFVVKSMAQSSQFVDIDKTTVMESISFISSVQSETGCFPQVGKVFSSYMKGGLADGDNPAGLTAFVLIALLESEFLDYPELNTTIFQGFQCLNGFAVSDVDTYTLAIMSYVYSLADKSLVQEGRMDEIFMEIEKRAQQDSGLKYWKREDDNEDKDVSPWYRAPSANIEMTAYILMAYLNHDSDNIGQVQPIVQWITKQRNPYGGFSSTQDTVVALQALAKFGSLTYSGDNDVMVDVDSAGSVTRFSVTDDNSLLYQSVAVSPADGPVNIRTTGKGCVLVQVSMMYNVYEEDKSEGPAFDVTVEVHRNKRRKPCDTRKIEVCARYLKSGGISNMAIIEVKMPSGWSPDSESLKQLPGVARTDVDNGKVDFYFDELTSTSTCVVFNVQQDIEMDTKPALVRVYDYYETAYEVTVPYTLTTGCGTKMDIPDNNEGLDCSVVQCREEISPLEPELPSCPYCPSEMTDDAFQKAVCDSKTVYKAWVGRKGKYPIKLKTNLRSIRKEDVSDFVYYKMDDSCSCPIVEESKEMKALIIINGDGAYDEQMEMIDLDSRVIVVKGVKRWEREVRILSTRKNKCRKLGRRRRKVEKMAFKKVRNLRRKNKRNRNNM